MPFFDFHVHPTLKSLLSDKPSKLSPWDKIDIRKIPPLLRCCTEFEYILQSQASLSQLQYNECRLICIALYAPERKMLENSLMQGQAEGPMGIYLNKQKLDDIINSRLQPYKIVTDDDLVTIFNAAQFGITDRSVVALKKKADYKPDDQKTIYVVFSVEGCHSFSSSLEKFDVNEIIANIDDLRSKVPLLSVNVTHLQQSPLCNHAFGMLFIAKDEFKPTGNGIAPDGIKIIQHCYRHGIMVDVKHMSLGARNDLYRLRKAPDMTAINQPLVCTHAGFTGISQGEICDYMYGFDAPGGKKYTRIQMGQPMRYGSFNRPSFNASSINLYNEDIMEILRSGGIIGLSLDKRILGFQAYDKNAADQMDYPLETEYISVAEEHYFFTKQYICTAFDDGLCIDWDEIAKGGEVNPLLGDYHLKHFMAHIIHLIKVATDNNYDVQKALTQVCIGSDYDGIINPVWCCDTTDELIYFKQRFEAEFMDFAKECVNEGQAKLPAGLDVKQLSDRLFYENGKNFVLNRLP